ncbi:chemotaxis protein [Lysobacter concretionis Ko07 = DSM 16239]|uniref:Chemotaxis protein CheA n=1 Tax=Lysobacter concretionis Ko07 = DSM 16239 TaxID=1122185 RepID=A0A0A0EN20_9GAMM|nr:MULTISPECIES: chemotaxis protein CheA [Lysobacter]KGM51533.1 chemotaxis protein [Lysobacter concretionis Ko07 = DSM 16239]QOD90619.1 chemotaxis protein CheA [Lysobacter sp. CW239]
MDITQFHAAFFEESREGLQAMEAGLLRLETDMEPGTAPGTVAGDTINVIFRAAHSIKGGAATFGFRDVTDLTHLLETLLDEARAGRRCLDPVAIDALLDSVDVLRGLLAVAEHGGQSDQQAMRRARAGLDRLLAAEAGDALGAAGDPDGAGDPEHWRIGFRPETSLFMTGNDPLRILRELGSHGALTATCLDDRLPAFDVLDPFEAHLAWDLMLPGTVPRAAIDEAFAWVEDQCELSIEAVAPALSNTASSVPMPSIDTAALSSDGDATVTATGSNAARTANADADTSIRVAVAKVDALINLVGELVITQAMLRQRSEHLDPVANETLLTGLGQLDRNTRDLQEAVLSVRMLPVEFAFSRFPRMVRDLASRLDKKVRLRTFGEATELDKGMIEKIVDPLVHLMRNAIDHGLESADERRAANKDETGTITMNASHQGGHIMIEVSDDGRGMDRERILQKAVERNLPLPENPTDAQVWDLVFHPGFSTADALSDLSGRGVGMDVVKSNILALGGQVEVRSERHVGTTVSIRLPLTLAILDGMSVAVGDEVFILPLNTVIESLQPQPHEVRTIAGDTRVLHVREDYLPLINLRQQYRLPAADGAAAAPIAVVVESGGRRLALEVDELLGQQQVVVKNLEANYRRIPGISGATILGDGRVALIIDAGGIVTATPLPAAA